MIRPLVHFVLPFALGVFVCLYFLPDGWQVWTAAAVLLLGLGLAWVWRGRRGMAALTGVGLAAGIVWMNGYAMMFLAPVEPLIAMEMTVTMELLEYPEEQGYGVTCVVSVEGIPGRVMYYGDAKLLPLEPGDKLTGTVKCYSAVEVGGKRSTAYTSRGIFLRLYGQGEMDVAKCDGEPVRYLPQRMKRQLCTTISEIFGEEVRGLVLAVLTGERSELDTQSASDLEESGLMHLSAVSGLHCGFLIAFLRMLVAGNPLLTALVGYPVLLLYMVVVGCTPSVVRACVMVGFRLLAPLVNRENDPPTSLASAALVILLANPFAIASVSFQLSFAAVIGLLTVTPRVYAFLLVRRKRAKARKAWAFLTGSISASLGALVFTAPLSAYYFKTIALVAPLSNLMVLPVMQALFACALVVTVLCMVSPMFSALALIPAILVKYVLWAAGFAAKLPGHAVGFNGYVTTMWLVFVYGLFLLCRLSADRGRKYVFALVLSALTLAAVRMLPVETVKDDKLTVVSVDVGQGAATLLHSGGVTALVDCGSYYSQRGSGACVSDAMDTYGWETLDYVALTHYHQDHAGGLDELFARTTVGTLLLPWSQESELSREVVDLAARYGIAVRYVHTTTTIPLGDANLLIYPQLTRGEVNEEGLTILCSAGDFDALFTGDMSASTERLLIKKYDLPDIEVLFVAHHGSKYSTSEEFLKTVTPEVGIISVGENSYGHPSMETMERMAFYGCELYRTDWQGNIVIQVHE